MKRKHHITNLLVLGVCESKPLNALPGVAGRVRGDLLSFESGAVG